MNAQLLRPDGDFILRFVNDGSSGEGELDGL